MRVLLDTRFPIWIVTRSRRLAGFPWLEGYRPWGLSPISLLEVRFLAEIGKLEIEDAFFDALRKDERFVLDEVPMVRLIEEALPLAWTRDPFDRLLSAHSNARKLPLCTVDEHLLDHHLLLPGELKGRRL